MIFKRNFGSAVLAGVLAASVLLACATPSNAQTSVRMGVTNLFAKPLSRAEALDIALSHNSAILQAKADIRANEGVISQTRSIALPRVSAGGSFSAQDRGSVEQLVNAPIAAGPRIPAQRWQSDLRVQQSIYEGGRVRAALRAVKLSREAAQLNYETTVADTLLAVRIAYDDVLLAKQQIEVQEASVKLLTQELEDVRKRFSAGTVPLFNVLRAEVELANAQPTLIRARNFFRISKNNVVNLLGWDLSRDVWENIPLELSDNLEAKPYDVELPVAIGRAFEKRTELEALRKTRGLRREDIINAKSGYKPSAQIFGGYQWSSPTFQNDLSQDFGGWFGGAQVSWNIFDGFLTRGKVTQAEALYSRAGFELQDTARQIELQVRTAYSDFIEAKEVLESQRKVQEQAEEALRLAEARMNAGTGTQLDVLSAQTSLTQARTTQIQALHDYSVARWRLERAMGEGLLGETK